MELLLFPIVINHIGDSFWIYKIITIFISDYWWKVISILKYIFNLALFNLTKNIKIECTKLNVYCRKNVNNRFFLVKICSRVEDKLMFLLRIQLKVFDASYYEKWWLWRTTFDGLRRICKIIINTFTTLYREQSR